MRTLLWALFAALASSASAADDLTLTLATPERAGLRAGPLHSAVELYRSAIAHDDLLGAVLLVARNGKVAVYEAMGWRDLEKTQAMPADEMFRMASNTKPVIATAIAVLQEQGKLRYDAPLREYIPAFDNYRGGFILIQHLLTHTSGLRIKSYFLEPLMKASRAHPGAPSLVMEVERFGAVGASVTPGTTFSYSNAGFNTLAGLVELRSGSGLEAFLKRAIYEPLGMKDSYNLEVAGHLDGKLSRMGVVYFKQDGHWKVAWKPGDPPTTPFARGSGGMVSTAWDYASFAQMFLNGGIYAGHRILKPETVQTMTTSQTRSMGISTFDYGYGWCIDVANDTFFHPGSDGTYAWVDRRNGIVGVILTQIAERSTMYLQEAFQKLVTSAALN